MNNTTTYPKYYVSVAGFIDNTAFLRIDSPGQCAVIVSKNGNETNTDGICEFFSESECDKTVSGGKWKLVSKRKAMSLVKKTPAVA